MSSKTRTLIIALIISSLALAGCKEPDYVAGIKAGEIELKDVPEEARTYEIYTEWVRKDAFNLKGVPHKSVDDKLLDVAINSIFDDNDAMDVFLDRLPFDVQNELVDSQVDRILQKYPGFILRLTPRVYAGDYKGDFSWSARHLRRALELTPYWGMLASREAPCDVVHEIPLEVWAKAINTTAWKSDYERWKDRPEFPQYIFNELEVKGLLEQ